MEKKKIKNPTGVTPIEYRILLEVEKVDDFTGSLYLPATSRDRQQYELTKGTIVAIGSGAFSDSKWSELEKEQLMPGTRVFFNKYAGTTFNYNEKMYRLCTDEDIIAILSEEAFE